MTAFLVTAALLIAAALFFIVPPLLRRGVGARVSRNGVNTAVYRDQLLELEGDLRARTLDAEHYAKARRELEARLLEDVSVAETVASAPVKSRRAAVVVGIAAPVLAAVLYLLVGNPQTLGPRAGASAQGPPHALDQQQILTMVERLAEKLKADPENAESWVMLARSYGALGRFDEAARAYASAVARVPDNAQLLADYADAAAMAQGRKLQGEPEKIIARALQVDPNNVKALALAGTVAFDKQDYRAAVGHWERILTVAPADSNIARSINASIAEAQALAAGKPVPVPAALAQVKSLSGVVKLAPALAAKVAPTDTVFIYARAAEGPRAPLAVIRKVAGELPVQFTLDDTMAMAPELKLSSFPRIVVGARISKAANAAPQPGDLQGVSATVANGATGVTVVIDRAVQ